jgi:hypothetical protein
MRNERYKIREGPARVRGRVAKRSGRNGTSLYAACGQELSELAGFEYLAEISQPPMNSPFT